MFGKNPKRKLLKGNGTELEVQEIFQTIQGEGPYVGYPSIFVRLGAVTLPVNFCDTEFESFQKINLTQILQKISLLSNNLNIKLVVITGGEPFRQPISNLCSQLLEIGFIVQIETNGTIYREIDERVEVVCSPKNHNGKYSKIRPDILERISAFKFIISANNTHYSCVSEVGQSLYNVPVYVQPMDECDEQKNKENLRFAMQLALKNGYNLSIQIHKILGIR